MPLTRMAAAPGHGVGRGHERVGAVVDIQHARPARPRTGCGGRRACVPRPGARHTGCGEAAASAGAIASRVLGNAAASPIDPARCRSRSAQRVVMRQSARRACGPRASGSRQIADADARGVPPCPRRPGRCRAASCRSCPYPGCCARVLARPVELACAAAGSGSHSSATCDQGHRSRDGHALTFAQLVDLLQQCHGSTTTPLPMIAQLAPHHARRQQADSL